MKNLKTVCTILIYVLYTSVNAQDKKEEQQDIATFEINDARDNGSDITPQALEDNATLVLYKLGDSNEVLLSNFWEKSKSQSFGRIYSIVKKEFPETKTEFKGELYNFQWSYTNTYDDKKGTAKVKLFVVYKPQGTYFEFTILPENLDVLVYKGIMSGDLTTLESIIKK
jgi:hypothetical protein